MNRRDFGAWGVSLAEGDFARALAARGVLEAYAGEGEAVNLPGANYADAIAERLNAIRFAQGDAHLPIRWHAFLDPPAGNVLAEALSAGWRQSALYSGYTRLEVDRFSPLVHGFDPPSTLPWVAAQLSHPDVAARSVYVRADEPAVEVGWQWPLRVGLLRDERSQALRERLEERLAQVGWMRPLVTLVDAEETNSACDLLLLPMDLRAALAAVAALPSSPQADATVVLGRTRGPSEQWYRQLTGLRATAQTSGVALAHVAAEAQADWFEALIETLSHNEPLDVALFWAAEQAQAPPPLIAASQRLVQFSRLATHVRRMATQFTSSALRDLAVNVKPGSSLARNLGVEGAQPLGEIGERMRGISEDEGYLHESDMATAVSELNEAVTAARPAPPPEDRFLQARFFDLSTPDLPEERFYRLRSGAPHALDVRIGTPSGDWITAPVDRPFPVEELPPDEDAHELTIVFTDLRLLDEPQVAQITLPSRGSSTTCRFYFFAHEGVEDLEARLIVLHRNRVLQTALLHGQIAPGPDEYDPEPDGGSLAVMPEVRARTALSDLSYRQRFGGALVLNHTATGTSGISGVADDRAWAFRVSGGMKEVVKDFDAFLTEVARERKSYTGFEAEATQNLLRKLAQHGTLLYGHIVQDGIGENTLGEDDALHIVSAEADARLPVEFIYDRRAPKDDAKLCEHAATALQEDGWRQKGRCSGEKCPHGPDERQVICPLGFWGLRRVLERHAHDPRLAELRTRGKDFAFTEPSTHRRTLEVLRNGLVAGSQRVNKTVQDGLDQICKSFPTGPLGAPLPPVETWKDWEQQIAKSGASLLVLLVHTGVSEDDDKVERMEIGKASWLKLVHLDRYYIRPDDAHPAPLVLLLGCGTDAAEVEFKSFVTQCRRGGAAIIVAAGATIHSVHAVPVARAFIETLREEVPKRDGVTFGEVMLAVRRKLLAQGLPMVLTLTAYGDADWQLAAAHSA